jgi:alpha-aminoadipate carrier protein LysW
LAADASRRAALLVAYILPVCALLAPCRAGASTPKRAHLFLTGSFGLIAEGAPFPYNPGPPVPRLQISAKLWKVGSLARDPGARFARRGGMASCPECDFDIDVDDYDVDKGDLISCPDCGSSLEVVNTSPIELEVAPDDDDDDEDDDDEDDDDEDEDEDEDEEEEDWDK